MPDASPPGDTDSMISRNFAFLARHDQLLVSLAALAEQNAHTDPNTSLLKLRQFGEALLQLAASRWGVDTRGLSQNELAQTLEREGKVDRSSARWFYDIRTTGNRAAHNFTGNTLAALRLLEVAHKAAIWFHQTFAEPSFRGPEFVPPAPSTTSVDELRVELTALRQEIARGQAEAAPSPSVQIQPPAADTRLQHDELRSALKAEVEQLLTAERARFTAELERVRAERAPREPSEAQRPPLTRKPGRRAQAAVPDVSPNAPSIEVGAEPPTCPDPSCGKPMIRRRARRGPNAGNEFWGCTGYPGCKQAISISPVVAEPSNVAAAPVALSRIPWRDWGERPGWRSVYATAGGRLRSYDAIAGQPQQAQNAVSQVALFTSGPVGAPISEAAERVVQVCRRIIGRGRRPPIDPFVEEHILSKAGLLAHTRPAQHPGDISRVLNPSATRVAFADVQRAIVRRDEFVLDGAAVGYSGEPLVHPDAELRFLDRGVRTALGENAGHWFVPQASLDGLLPASSTGKSAQRRVDFLVSHPLTPPFVVEIDGSQHRDAEAVDEDRDRELADAGLPVHRISATDVRRDPARAVMACASDWPRHEGIDSDIVDLLVWGPTVAHRITAAMVEALEAGWLTGAQWELSVDEPLGIAETCVRSSLELISAISSIWSADVAPQRVVLRAGGATSVFERDTITSYKPTSSAAPSDSPPDSLRISIDCFRGPFHILPLADGAPRVVVRSACLPLDVLDDRPVSGRRPTVADPETIESGVLTRVLQAVFAKREFQPEGPAPRAQELAIRRLLGGRDTVVLLPTGAGKSMIYQLAGLLMPGLTLIIDPIVSLIDDQIDGLTANGIDRAIGITSADTKAGMLETKLAQVRSGDALFAFIAPERLQQRSFRDAVRTLSTATPVTVAVIDEAHCVSEWGHDFRTSYLDLGKVLRSVAQDVAGTAPPLLALTGTASRAVLKDMLIELSIDRSDPDSIITPVNFDRRELRFSIVHADDDEIVPRVVGTVRGLPSMFRDQQLKRQGSDFLRPRGHESACGVVFCQTVNDRKRGVVAVSRALESALGIQAPIYCGKGPPGWNGFDLYKKRSAAAFKANDVPMLVATKAYGMGIDKPNVRYIVHVGVPGSIEAYYQEAGRAGRDRREAHCVIVHSPSDREVHEYFHGNTFRGVEFDFAEVRATLQLIGEIGARRTVKIPMGDANEQRERAIHRLKLLGLVSDYLVDWGGKLFELKLRNATLADVDLAVVNFVRRSQPGRVAAYEALIAADPPESLHDRAMRHAERMIAFVYETIVASRKRAVEEMALVAETCRTDDQIRDRILRYIELGRVAAQLDELVDIEPFEFGAWQNLYGSIETADDAREWRGATARTLASEPDHPGLLVGRGLAEAVVANGNIEVFSSSIAAGARSALAKYALKPTEVAGVLGWIIAWTRERRPAWAPLVYVIAERALGESHLQYLQTAETGALGAMGREAVAELPIVLARRVERFTRALARVTQHHTRTHRG